MFIIVAIIVLVTKLYLCEIILSTEKKLSNFQTNKEKQFKIENDNGEEIFVQGDDIIKLPDGSLTTMYHYLKNSEKGIEEVLSTTKFEGVDA